MTRRDISITTSALDEPAWIKGQLVADNVRLVDFIEELSRYRPGILRCDRAVAELRISGVFRVADTDEVLGILRRTLPIRLAQVTGYWVTVGPA